MTRIRRARAEDAPAIARMAAALSAAEGSPAPAFDAAACQYHGFGKDPCFEFCWPRSTIARQAMPSIIHPTIRIGSCGPCG